ncbi:MAG: hypothetical protein ACJ798_14530 [Phenylobacterium sp.]
MKAATVLLVTLGLACASVATASERVTDLDYLKANRCKGLATGLGSGDTAGLDAMIKAESRNRQDAVLFRAQEEQARAKHETARADSRDRLNAELTGPCLAYMSGGKEASTGR